MRPFTNAVFEREGKAIVGHRWTLEQVHQAYEKADDLLDYVSEYKVFDSVQKLGLNKLHPGFRDGLAFRTTKGLKDEAVQSLGLNIFRELLDRGSEVVRFAAWAYKSTPDIFKARYAASKPAYLKDRFLLRSVPVYSFSPFDTGDNPATTQDEKLSQKCADMYRNSRTGNYSKNEILPGYVFWLRSSVGDKFFNETIWLKKTSYEVEQRRLGICAPVIPFISSQMQKTHE